MVGQRYCEIITGTDSDISQEAIVQNANTTAPGIVDNFSGDDEAKTRGLKYAVTGDCNSPLVRVVNLGYYDMQESLLELYGWEMAVVFHAENYIIGNAVLFPHGICHSFVLMGMAEDKIQIFDPWDGSVNIYTTEEVFESGFCSARGVGVIKWMQYIAEGAIRN